MLRASEQTVTLNELSRSLGMDRNLLSGRDDGTFMLMDQPIVLCNAMTRVHLYKGAEHPHAAQKPEAWTL